MRISIEDLETAKERLHPLNKALSGIDSLVLKYGWEKIIRNVGDLRTTFLDDHIDLLAAGKPSDEEVEIIK